ncbi:MAG: hypothetical protein ACK5WR_11555 [Planctomycetaceae bacterium]
MRNRWGWGALCVFAGLGLAGWLSPRATTAQIGGNRGFFGSLKVGDMVETAYDAGGRVVLRTYDDDANRAKMIARITEIGSEYLVLEVKAPDPTSREMWSIRYPMHSIGSIFHITGAAAGAAPGEAGPPAGEAGKPKTGGGIKSTKPKK